MRMALRLAEKARGRTSPNPMVGAVVVKDGTIVGRGYHKKAGMPHAEAVALQKAGAAAEGATLYVTLEPCSHTDKRTPPCALAVKQSRIRRVVTAMIDPNPKVSGGGVRILKTAGIEVTTGVLEDEAKRMNEAYRKYVTTGMPFVILKIAQTLDGKIATASGESKWITGAEARKEAHRLRDGNDAILAGINTVLKDDPSLTARLPGGRDPLRVIVDSRLRIPLNAKVLHQQSFAGALIATVSDVPRSKIAKVQQAGAEVIMVKGVRGNVDLGDLMKKLGKMDIMSVLIEGGSEVNASALKEGIVDKVVLFVAPLIMSGRDSVCSIGGTAPDKLSKALRLKRMTITPVGQDLMIEGYLK